jgi:hypothetical protein
MQRGAKRMHFQKTKKNKKQQKHKNTGENLTTLILKETRLTSY